MESNGSKLKKLIKSGKIVLMPNVWDGFSAKVVEHSGFEAALVSGAGLSESRLAKPDLGLMGLRDNLDGTRIIANSTNLLLIADGDTGYGNAMSVYYTVQEFEKTGVAGVMIEDQVWPKRCGHLAGKEVIPTEEMIKKIKAAVDARVDPDFIIKARTDAAATSGVNEAIDRLNKYIKAGADLVFADALLSLSDIEKVAASVNGPLAVNMGFGIRSRPTTPLATPKMLQEMGVAVVDYGRITSAAAIRGMMNALEALKSTINLDYTKEYPELLVSFDELQEIMAYPEWMERDGEYK